jgi:hypothetical protein
MKYKPIVIKGRVVGHVSNGTFYKSINGSMNFLKDPPAICSDTSALLDAEKFGAKKMLVTDKETGIRYMTTIAHFYAMGFKVNRGFGEQLGLRITEWKIYPVENFRELINETSNRKASD